MNGKVSWGILGTGRIATKFVPAIKNSEKSELLAVGSRAQESANKFGEEHGVPRAYGSYDELLADSDIDVVYVATPHPMHAEWAIKAADAGKHLLVEKPLGLNHPEAMTVVEAAHRNGVFLMEGFIYRCHPLTRKLIELIREGAIGKVRVIESRFGTHADYDLNFRYLNHKLGGGAILDMGCYCLSLIRLVAGAAIGKPFADPLEIQGYSHIGEESRVDEYTVADMRFPENILARAVTGLQVDIEPMLEIYGSEGSIAVPRPTKPALETGVGSFVLQRRGQEPEQISVDADKDMYTMEVDTVVSALERKHSAVPEMTWEDSLGNMRALDMWRAAVGLQYDMEKPEAMTLPFSKRPLSVREPNKMKYDRIEGVNKPISRLIMGADNQRSIAHASAMFDDFIERGGNCFDTAYIYGGGMSEKLVGQWIRNRNIREQVVILGKGAHTPHCDPESITRQLSESLERLQTDYIDIYVMHRDNPDIPVGEFVEVLNEHQRAGRIRIFGGSNWTTERMDQANEYARSKGLSGFSVLSNNFSLARMVEPPWRGCISASDSETRAWLTKTQTPLMPWSSQARGFFTDRANPNDRSDPELVRCWYSDDNFKRRERVVEMAKQRGVLPINIALAYVLCQPFPTFPLIGPRQLSETRTSFPALDVELTPEEVRWLNLED